MPATKPVYRPRASGFCSTCDSWFHDEPAYAWRNPRVRGGWMYAEARHVAERPNEHADPARDGLLGERDVHTDTERC